MYDTVIFGHKSQIFWIEIFHSKGFTYKVMYLLYTMNETSRHYGLTIWILSSYSSESTLFMHILEKCAIYLPSFFYHVHLFSLFIQKNVFVVHQYNYLVYHLNVFTCKTVYRFIHIEAYRSSMYELDIESLL